VQDVMKETNTTLAKQWCGVDEDKLKVQKMER